MTCRRVLRNFFWFWLLAVFLLPAASAQGYPNRALRLIVPFSAGGANDSVARLKEIDKYAKLIRSANIRPE